ncbi:MAG TPA: sigma 54-interacting transcriptional regulator [Myxococcota bacterium]|nr:sigma 54-interacting transcriptional regulator [Myxococcota bacterium]HRY92061.1 sigma 54-interacting transcriptional regulator [Myxococcota bacterium]HSA21443.1 sigma 54-interacting transcriptional regulator [Myxococcota bacterium]
MLRLRRLPEGPVFDFPEEAESVSLGRGAPADLVLDDPHVSALHARIQRRGEGYAVEDLRSTNGSALERAGLRTPLAPGGPGLELRTGDRLLLGSDATPLVLEVLAASAGASAAGAGAAPPAGLTLVATARLAGALELSGRLQAAGRGLAPFLELAEALGRADEAAAVRRVAAGWLPGNLPGADAGLWLGPADAAREVLWGPAAALDAWTAPPPGAAGELLVLRPADARGAMVAVPLPAPQGAVASLLVRFRAEAPPAEELDGLQLAAAFLARRLAELAALAALERARAQLLAQNRYLRERAEGRAGQELVGRSAAMERLRKELRGVAVTDATVLVLGPSGSGKELVARELHRQSLRHAGLFAALNCGALVDSLLESELFGHRKGAFTGAHRDREGLFEVAHGGSLFLDEIGEMSPALQVKLLRVLETREVQPVGGTRTKRVDVRVICATHRDLAAEVRAGRFREDLFYRIHVFPLKVPSLAERREDIPLLVEHLLARLAAQDSLPVPEVSPEAMRALSARDYPGNVRELSNEVHRALIAAAGEARIELGHLAFAQEDPLARACRAAGQGELKAQLARVERILVEEALTRCGGNRTHAARQLGITRQALLLKLERLGLKPPAPSDGGDA